MAKNPLPDLTPAEVIRLQDSLLANADRLLSASLAVLELGSVGLARSLAVLGLEESGKAIALHRRRVCIAYESEGSPFVNEWLQKLWGHHNSKLALVHEFLVQEDYWFGTKPPDSESNRAALGEIMQWSGSTNMTKQRGFYVDVDEVDRILEPEVGTDEQSLRQIVDQVHQIGWQIRLGEHIEAKQQEASIAGIPAASAVEIEQTRELYKRMSVEESTSERIIAQMSEGQKAKSLNNNEYRLTLPPKDGDPFAKLGKPGFEAETRELLSLVENAGVPTEPCEPDGPTSQA